MQEARLWEDAPKRYVPGEVRRALDRDLAAARERGKTFLETEVAAVRRQANDLDRLERVMAAAKDVRTWDYSPKTQAHQAYLDAVRRLFGSDDDDDDPFVRAVRDLDAARDEEAARARAAEALDASGPEPAD